MQPTSSLARCSKPEASECRVSPTPVWGALLHICIEQSFSRSRRAMSLAHVGVVRENAPRLMSRNFFFSSFPRRIFFIVRILAKVLSVCRSLIFSRLFLIGHGLLRGMEHGEGVFCVLVCVSMCAAHTDGQALTASFAFSFHHFLTLLLGIFCEQAMGPESRLHSVRLLSGIIYILKTGNIGASLGVVLYRALRLRVQLRYKFLSFSHI